MTTALIYHKSDLDGIGSAAVVLKKYPAAELFPAEYGYETYDVSDFTGKDVIIVDFTPIQIKLIMAAAKSCIWFDHHKTTKEDYPDLWANAPGVREIESSAIKLTWEYFFPDKDIPKCVELIEDYDIWVFRYGDMTRAFGEYAPMFLKFPDNANWQQLFNDDKLTDKYVESGKTLLLAKTLRIEKTFDQLIERVLWGYKVGIVNSNHDISNTGNYIASHGYDVGLIWRMIREEKIVVGLRSIGDVDVSKIAKSYNGGGHKNAAAFNIPLKTFREEILI